MDPSNKTVFVLGAGFSRFAGYPLQAEILERFPSLTFMDAPSDTFDSYVRTLETVEDFRKAVFPDSDLPVLEDVFTLLDQTIARREHCSGYSWEKLEEIREAFKRAILFSIHAASESVEPDPRSLYDRIAGHLIDLRTKYGQESDPFSVVSLNWDCLLEDSFYRCIHRTRLTGEIDIDYCCYTDPLGRECPHTPSLLQRAKGLYNLKTLKLHGSTNWLRCPNCNRLFTGVGDRAEAWSKYANPQGCSVCPVSPGEGMGAVLEPFFITPTFVKVFDNAHIQTIWQNAYVELTEASEVVFLGYSLPAADYHVRTLLRRSVQPGTRIVAVLAGNDEPKRNTPAYLAPAFASSRYQTFFGADKVEIETGGVESYFEKVLGTSPLERALRRSRRRLRDRARQAKNE